MKNLIILILCLFYLSTHAQVKSNSIYVEAGGNGIIYSVNYDRIIPLSDKIKLAPRIGIEYYPHDKSSLYNDIAITLEVNTLWSKNSKNKNHFETGLGLSLISMKEYDLNSDNNIVYQNKFARIGTLRLGFRHQKPTGGFMYRIGILARISQDEFSESLVGDDLFYRLWPGVSLGYTF